MNELEEKERKLLAHIVIDIDELIDVNINMAIDCLKRLESYCLKNTLNDLRQTLKGNITDEREIDIVSEINEIQKQLNNIL